MYSVKKFKALLNGNRQNISSLIRKIKMRMFINIKDIEHLKPKYVCKKKWYGNNYGGFYINPDLVDEDSVVYSFGIGKDISFDKQIITSHRCKVFGFDPTPKSIDYIKSIDKEPLFTFFDFGISTTTGNKKFYLPTNKNAVSASLVYNSIVSSNEFIEVKMKSFEDISRILGHKHIDVVKMDIEGAEYEVLESFINSEVSVKQLLIEFHDRLYPEELKSKKITDLLYKSGFEIFASSLNYEEISFINTKL